MLRMCGARSFADQQRRFGAQVQIAKAPTESTTLAHALVCGARDMSPREDRGEGGGVPCHVQEVSRKRGNARNQFAAAHDGVEFGHMRLGVDLSLKLLPRGSHAGTVESRGLEYRQRRREAFLQQMVVFEQLLTKLTNGERACSVRDGVLRESVAVHASLGDPLEGLGQAQRARVQHGSPNVAAQTRHDLAGIAIEAHEHDQPRGRQESCAHDSPDVGGQSHEAHL